MGGLVAGGVVGALAVVAGVLGALLGPVGSVGFVETAFGVCGGGVLVGFAAVVVGTVVLAVLAVVVGSEGCGVFYISRESCIWTC
jgi:hypothetical protein